MVKQRILFVAEAVTLAHVGRMIKLAAGLDRTQFSLTLAWDGRFNSLVGHFPAPWVPLETIPTPYFIERLSKGLPIYTHKILDRYIRTELELFRATSPTVVVGDTRLSLAISTAVAKIPYVNVVNAHWSPFSRTPWIVPQWPVVDLFGPSIGQKIFDCVRPFFFWAFARGMNSLYKKWGLPKRGSDLRATYSAGDRVVYPDIREMVPTEGLPPTHRYLGLVTWSPDIPMGDDLHRPAAGKKTVYVAMGTSGRKGILPIILGGLKGRPLRVLLSKGSENEIHNPDPENLELITAPSFSGEAACGISDLVIHNGGSGTISQCVTAGVPFIGIAVNLDQFSSMHFAQQTGLGITLRADQVCSTDVTRCVAELLDNPDWKENALNMRSAAQTYDPCTTLSKVLKELENKPCQTF